VLGSVQASFLAAAFEAIDADYGDLKSYLRDGLGLGRPNAPISKRAICSARVFGRSMSSDLIRGWDRFASENASNQDLIRLHCRIAYLRTRCRHH
jgi:hypothetical protein